MKPDGEKPRLRWWMLAVLLTVMTVGALGRYAFSPLGLMIMEDLKIGKGAFGALSSSIAVGAALTTLWAGLLIDRLGVRRMAFVGNLVMGVFLLGFFLPQTFLTAGLILFLAGLGFSVVTPATNSGIVDWFPRSERAFSLGLKQAGVPLGTALTAAAMPFLALRLGWRAALGCLGAVLVGAAFLTYAFYRDGPFAGEAAAAGGGGARGTVSRLLRDPNMVYLCLLGLSFCVLQMAVVTFLVPYLQEFFGMSVVEAGAYLGLSQVAGSASRPLVGLVSDRLFGGRRKETLCGVAGLAVAASVLFAFSPPAAPRWALTLIVVLVGAATLGWVGPFFILAIEQAGAGLSGAASGLSVTVNLVGVIIGPPIFGYIVDWTSSYRLGLVVVSACLVAGATLFALFFREGRRLAYGASPQAMAR